MEIIKTSQFQQLFKKQKKNENKTQKKEIKTKITKIILFSNNNNNKHGVIGCNTNIRASEKQQYSLCMYVDINPSL